MNTKETPAVSGRNPFLDVLKGICILFVVIVHYNFSDREKLQLLFPFYVDMAVPVFMMITGYVYALSYRKNNIDCFEKAYEPWFVASKIIRYLVPFTIAFILYRCIGLVFGWHDNSPLAIIRDYLQGGTGSGSYYTPLMLQLVIIFPVIYMIIRRKDRKGLTVLFFANGIYELLQWAYGMSDGLYRMLIFRYLLIIAFGCYLAIGKTEITKKEYIAGFVTGLVYIVVFRYLGFVPVVTTKWTKTSFIACMYIMPVFAFMVKNCRFRCRPLEMLGKASFNIFLTQMIYYLAAGSFYRRITGRMMQLLVSVGLSTVCGVIFYMAETPVTKRILAGAKKYFS